MSKNRSIFEEVGDSKPKPSDVKPVAAQKSDARKGIARWLMVLFALVIVMIVVGGLTRLTDSGLSITEWRPVTGAIPPMDAETWASEFEKYKAIPEYQLQNSGMTLEAFKSIYWWEWGHRQLGRVIGLVWAVGFLWFLLRKEIPRGWTQRLVVLGALGGAQGAIGWWMVSSGLGGEALDVASYRLAIHLGLAFAILGLITWSILRLGRGEAELLQARRLRQDKLARFAAILLGMVFFQVILGALVAGIDAGRTYPEWPLMAGEFLPPDPLELQPVWRNFFENSGTVQFVHRLWAYLIFAKMLMVVMVSRKSPLVAVRQAFAWMGVMIFGQVVLGIITVLHISPWHLAISHQLLAVIVFVLILRARFAALYPVEQKIARI